ncbi:MAG: DinB family protein [Aureispira sp.]
MQFPTAEEHDSYYTTYIGYLPKRDPIQLLQETKDYGEFILEQVSDNQSDYAYAAGKWTIKALLLHIIDTEQIMAYRALRFARNDFASALPYEQDDYALHSRAENIDWAHLKTHFSLVRATSIQQFSAYDQEQEARGGSTVFPNTVRAVASILSGHQLHHLYVLQSHYLKQEPILLDTFLADKM